MEIRSDFQFEPMKEPTRIKDLKKEHDDWKRLEKWQVGRRNFP